MILIGDEFVEYIHGNIIRADATQDGIEYIEKALYMQELEDEANWEEGDIGGLNE